MEVALGIVLAVLILKHLQVIFGLGVIAVAVAIVALVFGGAFIWLAGEWQQNGLRDVGGGIASIAVGAVVLAGVCGLFGLGAELESRTKIVDTTEFVFLAVAGWEYVAETQGSKSAAIGFPIELLYAAAPAFGVLIAIFSLERLMPWAEFCALIEPHSPKAGSPAM